MTRTMSKLEPRQSRGEGAAAMACRFLGCELTDDGLAALAAELDSRLLDIGQHDDPAVADLLATFRADDEAAEEIRVGRKREARARTVETFEVFKAQREQASAAPTGTRIVHLRDETTGQLHKLALPVEFFVD